MIVSFKDLVTENIFNGISSKGAMKRLPNTLCKIAVRKLDQLDSVIILDELKVPPGNHLEKLSGDRNGEYCIRINQQYRICFIWTDSGPDKVEIIDYH